MRAMQGPLLVVIVTVAFLAFFGTLANNVEGFQAATTAHRLARRHQSMVRIGIPPNAKVPTPLLVDENRRRQLLLQDGFPLFLARKTTTNVNNDEHTPNPSRTQRWRKRIQSAMAKLFTGPIKLLQSRKTLRISLALALAATTTMVSGSRCSTFSGIGGGMVPAAHAASAPVMALPKAEGRDPVTEAISVYERQQTVEAQRELQDMAATARRIEAEEGEGARMRYEKDYKEAQLARANAKRNAMEQLKRDLLDQGICPFTDLEGQRQVVLLQKGVDLGKVQGTPFYLEKEWETKNPARSMKVKKAANRRVVACMVQDMKNRDIDPLDYFQKHQDQTEAILDMKAEQAMRLVQQYEANLEEYGQITVPKEGEMSVKEKMAMRDRTNGGGAIKAAKAKKAAEAKAAAKAEAAKQKRIAKEEKAKWQAEAKAAKVAAKEEANRLKEQAKLAAVAAAAATAAAVAASNDALHQASDSVLPLPPDTTTTMEQSVENIHKFPDNSGDDNDQSVRGTPSTTVPTTSIVSSNDVLPKAVAAIAIAGSGGFAIKVYRDKAAADEVERRRQFKLLMDGSSTNNNNNNGDNTNNGVTKGYQALAVDTNTSSDVDRTSSRTAQPPNDNPAPTSAEDVTPVKKKGLGIKNMFGKKKNARETDLMVLVRSDATASAFTTILAKLLVLGAPGRFPNIVALPDAGGDMSPMERNNATDVLVTAQHQAGLSQVQSAEIFANVVNCMLIDIVDLASTSLKEKDDQVTIDAINIVVDFMNHAASLFQSIADGVTIQPVTYGGDLAKSKLEQMFSTYASSAMLNLGSMPDDFDSRVSLLQDVFEINDNKAQSLMVKAMQKNMAEMMKTEDGMKKVEEMMKSMGGGMEGLAGLGGLDGDGPSPEALKEMLTALKEMKESGSIPPEEFDQVKKQFHEAYGSSIDDIVKEADASNEEMSATDRELLQLMKSIMAD